MEYEIEFGGEPQDVTVTLSGRATPLGFRHLVRDLEADPRAVAEMVMLVDLSKLDTSTLSSEDLAETAEPVALRDARRPARAVAIVAPDAATSRYAQLLRAHLGGSKSRRQVFRSREEAIAWLRERSKPR